MPTIPLDTIACTVDETGISAPSYPDILATLQARYQAIFGSDIVLDNSTQDGQWLAIQAAAQNDTNSATIAAYNQFSPTTAVGVGLSSIVKTNGLQREVPSNSTADITVIGPDGTIISGGIVSDVNGLNTWALPATVAIDGTGEATVTATCTAPGAITATSGTLTRIVNPQRGWQSATNASAAAPGAPVELDPALRQRQAASTAQPALTPLQAITANVANVPGVTSVSPYENDTSTTDGNGIPGHSICLVVSGGDATAIATAINNKKGPGGGTYGTTSITVEDPAGIPKTINFFRPTPVRIVISLTLTPLTGYVSSTKTAISNALIAWVTGLSTGYAGGVANGDLVAAAKLPAPLGLTYKIEAGALEAMVFGGSLGTADIALAFNQEAMLQASDITIAP
jgi:uncharacterized phage protein gp47/JayE